MPIIRRPAPFVLVSSGHGTLIVNRNDFHMVSPTNAFGVGHQILSTSYYDPEEVGILLSLLRLRQEVFGKGVIAIDCGANIGVHTVEWAKEMFGWGEVIAFEAQERIYYALAGNLAINNCLNATAHYAAVGAQVGEIGIPRVNYLQPSSFGSLELRQGNNTEFIGQELDYSPGKLQSTRMVTIDSLGLTRLDFIKIDVERMELDVLAGAAQSLAQHKPALFIEVLKTDPQELHRVLKNHDYQVYDSGPNLLALHRSDPCNQHVKAN